MFQMLLIAILQITQNLFNYILIHDDISLPYIHVIYSKYRKTNYDSVSQLMYSLINILTQCPEYSTIVK